MDGYIDKPAGDKWLTLAEVQQQTGGSRTTIHRWRTERGLRWVKIGGFVRVRQSDLDDFLAGHRQ
jgi:excisionase family DNA binding protein